MVRLIWYIITNYPLNKKEIKLKLQCLTALAPLRQPGLNLRRTTLIKIAVKFLQKEHVK